jgi:hypothetical protein
MLGRVSEGSGSRNKAKATQRFDSEKLAKLTRKVADDAAAPPPPAEPAPAPAPPIAMPRAMTVEDPITTQLLAEIARTSETVELDEDMIDDVVDKLGDAEKPHPHTRRRRKS